MHTHITSSSLQSEAAIPEANGPPKPRPRDDADRCRHCGPGICILDEREGVIFCNNCGIVETMRSVNVQPEYNAAPEVGRHQRGRARILSGVSDWVMAKNRPLVESHSVHYREFMEDLEHWNHLLGHSVDVLRGMGRALSDWSDPGHSRISRAVAALLWPLICDQLPQGQEIRRRLRCGFSFQKSTIVKKKAFRSLRAVSAVPRRRHVVPRSFTARASAPMCLSDGRTSMGKVGRTNPSAPCAFDGRTMVRQLCGTT